MTLFVDSRGTCQMRMGKLYISETIQNIHQHRHGHMTVDNRHNTRTPQLTRQLNWTKCARSCNVTSLTARNLAIVTSLDQKTITIANHDVITVLRHCAVTSCRDKSLVGTIWYLFSHRYKISIVSTEHKNLHNLFMHSF